MGIDTVDVSEVQVLRVDELAEVEELTGQVFVTPWFQMDSERVEAFERGTYIDSYPHLYGGEVAYGHDLIEGFHLLGMLDYLVNHSLYCTAPSWLAWNYGLDHARFVSPVRIGDRFRVRGTVDEVIDRDAQGWLLVLDLVGQVQNREKPGFTARLRVLWTIA
jgi:acyl dehydratase